MLCPALLASLTPSSVLPSSPPSIVRMTTGGHAVHPSSSSWADNLKAMAAGKVTLPGGRAAHPTWQDNLRGVESGAIGLAGPVDGNPFIAGTTAAPAASAAAAPLIGGGKDAHGCIATAGYKWCGALSKVLPRVYNRVTMARVRCTVWF